MKSEFLKMLSVILWLGFNNAAIAEVVSPIATNPHKGQSAVLTVVIGGTVPGTIVSNPVGIDCGADCTESYHFGTSVLLIAKPETGSALSSCVGCSKVVGEKYIVDMDKNKEVRVGFTNEITLEQKQWNLEFAQQREKELQIKKEEAEKLDNLAKKEAELKQFEKDLENKQRLLNQLELELKAKYYEPVENTDTIVDTDDSIPNNECECECEHTSKINRKYIIYVPTSNRSKIIVR